MAQNVADYDAEKLPCSNNNKENEFQKKPHLKIMYFSLLRIRSSVRFKHLILFNSANVCGCQHAEINCNEAYR